MARGLSSLQFLFFLFPAATIKDSFLLWRNDLEQSREPGVLGQEAGLRVGLRVACTEVRARAGVPKVVQDLVNICIFLME